MDSVGLVREDQVRDNPVRDDLIYHGFDGAREGLSDG
jgi:hypothetical protein